MAWNDSLETLKGIRRQRQEAAVIEEYLKNYSASVRENETASSEVSSKEEPEETVCDETEGTIPVSSGIVDDRYYSRDGVTYTPVSLDPGATFLIPVGAFDFALPVQADTIAMSTPHLIDYTLHFDSSTIQ